MKKLAIYKNDPWLEPYAPAIDGRHLDAIRKEEDLTQECKTLGDFANAHQYFGLHRRRGGWVFREWAPNATAISLIGDFSDWQERPEFALAPAGNGVWELSLPAKALKHGQLYKMRVHWPGGEGDRIPAYATRVVQDPQTNIFSAQIWNPKPTNGKPKNSYPTHAPC